MDTNRAFSQEFIEWYTRYVGITPEQAIECGVTDVGTMYVAFCAGKKTLEQPYRDGLYEVEE